MDEPDRNLVRYSGEKSHQARNFLSKDDLKNKILAFIDYFNAIMAKPFKWTYQGKVLAA
jgi:hypothetical protein